MLTSTGVRAAWLVFLALVCAVSMTAEEASPTELDAETVVARHLAALGGSEALASLHTLEQKGTYHFNGESFPFTIHRRLPDHYRFELRVGDDRIITQISDGTTVWQIDTGRPQLPTVMEASQAGPFVEEFLDLPGLLARREALGVKVELLGEAEVDGEPAHHLRLTLKSGRVQDWYLDQETYLLLRKVTPQVHSRAGDYERTWYFQDYEPVAGVPVARYFEREDRQHVRAYEIEEVSANPELADDLFAAPEEIVATPR